MEPLGGNGVRVGLPFCDSLSSTARNCAIRDEVEEEVKAALAAFRSRVGAVPLAATCSVMLSQKWRSWHVAIEHE